MSGIPSESFSNALRDAYKQLLSLSTCDVKASATQTCAARVIEVDCDATVLCCNSNSLQVLDCSDGISATLLDVTTNAISNNAALYAYVEGVLKSGNNWTDTDSMTENLLRFFGDACDDYSNVTQAVYGNLVLNKCDDILITMFNRSSGRVQCGITAMASLFPQPVVQTGGNPLSLNETVVKVCAGVGAVGALALIAVITLGALYLNLKRSRAAPLK